MTAEEYAGVAEEVRAKVVEVITPQAPKAQVLWEDPVSFDTGAWAAGLLSAGDPDAQGQARIHTWLVTFAGSDEMESSRVRCVEPVFRFRLQFFHWHGPGSEALVRAEALRVQWTIAATPKLTVPGVVAQHRQLPIRVRLATMSEQVGPVIHRGEGELAVEIQPLVTH